MIDAITHIASALCGGGIVFLIVRPRLDYLRRITDRDERGRFVKREP